MTGRPSSRATLALAAALLAAGPGGAAAGELARRDFLVESEPGIELFVREVHRGGTTSGNPPVLLLHGARVPGLASFDLPVPNGSLAADLAQAGYPVYVMDVRGYGRSTRPQAMSEPRAANPPLVRTPAAAADIAAVVDWIRERRSVEQVALLGWATGGLWCGYYASLHPESVSHLILFNTLYGGSDEHPLLGHGSSLEDPAHPGRFNAGMGAYRYSTAESLFGAWDRSIPVADKASWRDPRVAAAYAAAALASDATSDSRTPPSFRAPSGAMEDSFYIATGHQLWDATFVRAAVLIIASGNDFWSRPADRETLARHLVHASRVQTVVIPGATHHVHLDRAEHGRRRFLEAVLAFLGKPH